LTGNLLSAILAFEEQKRPKEPQNGHHQLYSQGRLSIGKARELAEMPLWEFRQLLASRHISPHCDETYLEQDAAMLREMEQR
jgi:hypothetical protein